MKKLVLFAMLALLLFLPKVDATIQAHIDSVKLDAINLYPKAGFSSDFYVQQNTRRRITIDFKNSGTENATYLVGLTIGSRVVPGVVVNHSCNQKCYDKSSICSTPQLSNDPNLICSSFYRNLSKDYWVAKVFLQSGDSYHATMNFDFSDFFNIYDYYEIGVAIWKETETPSIEMLDSIEINNTNGHSIFITPFIPPPQGSNLTITGLITDTTNIYPSKTVGVTVRVKNTGIIPLRDIYVGLTLGQPPTTNTVTCNKDCYRDGLGDYGIINNLAVDEEKSVKRVFQIDKNLFTSGSAEWITTANPFPYTPPDYTLSKKKFSTTIIPLSQAWLACPTSLYVSSPQVYIGDTVTMTASVQNQLGPHKFYIGMSIGQWGNTIGNVTYSTPQPATILPCNIDCYSDMKPCDVLGIHYDNCPYAVKFIDTNYTDFVTRSFLVPDYFTSLNNFDVAVGVWGSVNLEAENNESLLADPLCFYYFRNAVQILPGESVARELSNLIGGTITGATAVVKSSMGTDVVGARAILWVIIMLILDLIIFFFGRHSDKVLEWVGIFDLIFLGIGALPPVGFIPTYFFVVLIVIAGFIIWKVLAR